MNPEEYPITLLPETAKCFGGNLSELCSSDRYAIAAIMAQVEGWERSKKTKRLSNYGKQRPYERKEEQRNA